MCLDGWYDGPVPIYTYECDRCGSRKEEWQDVGAKEPECPAGAQCDGDMVRVIDFRGWINGNCATKNG